MNMDLSFNNRSVINTFEESARFKEFENQVQLIFPKVLKEEIGLDDQTLSYNVC